MEELFELFREITEHYIDVSRQGYEVVDAVADVLTEKGYTVLDNEHYCKLVGQEGEANYFEKKGER